MMNKKNAVSIHGYVSIKNSYLLNTQTKNFTQIKTFSHIKLKTVLAQKQYSL